jgi:hypothetical protein
MANPTDVDVTNKLVTLIQAALPNAQVWPWIRYPASDRDDEWIALYTKQSNNADITAWMLHRLADDPSVGQMNDLVYDLGTWRILGIRGIVDTGVYTTTSAGIFQGEYNSVKAAINADNTLGFGPCNISHRGMKAVTIQDGLFSGRLCHIAECRLSVEIYNV